MIDLDGIKGWLPDEEAAALHRHAFTVHAPLLEIGAYCGRSTVVLADAARATGNVLFSIDTHRGSPEMAPGGDCHDPDLIVDGRHDSLPFLRAALAERDLEPYVVLVIGDSRIIGRWWRQPCGLLFIDGGHDPQTVTADLAHYTPSLLPDGVLAAHDYTIEHIAEQVDRLGLPLVERVGCLAVFRR